MSKILASTKVNGVRIDCTNRGFIYTVPSSMSGEKFRSFKKLYSEEITEFKSYCTKSFKHILK